ncbi:hypothetical protein KXV85_005321, partial [Aspergillus fumigatus]
CRTPDRPAQRTRPVRPGRRVRLVRQAQAAGGVPGGSEGRRHRRQHHAARRIPLRQPRHRGERDPCRPSQSGREADVPRLVLHLSETGSPAAARRQHAVGAAGADQRALCHRQDCRDQDGGSLSQPVWQRLHQRDADQSLRRRRQLSSRIQPCRRGADPPLPRGQ